MPSSLSVEQDSACVADAADGKCDTRCTGGLALCSAGRQDPCTVGQACYRSCQGEGFEPVRETCTSSCMGCDSYGKAVCTGIGTCSCIRANVGDECQTDAQCRGGARCTDVGACIPAADTFKPCLEDSQCSNFGACLPRLLTYRRHERAFFATGITAGNDREDGCVSKSKPCPAQPLSFTIALVNQSAPVLEAMPELTVDGRLGFNLTKGETGWALFTITLSDGEKLFSLPLNISVVQTAAPPAFELPTNISVFEDSGRYQKKAAINITVAPGFNAQFARRGGNYINPLFLPNDQPSLALDGTLTFTPAPNMAGFATFAFILQQFGSTATPAVRSITIYVQEVADAPMFALSKSRMSVRANSGLAIVPDVVRDATGETYASLFFVVDDLSDPRLFLRPPEISARTGEMIFMPARDASGMTSVTVSNTYTHYTSLPTNSVCLSICSSNVFACRICIYITFLHAFRRYISTQQAS
jgi:hypothetical protein